MEKHEAIPEPVTDKSLIEQQIEMLKILLERNAITIDAYNKGMQYLTQQNGKKIQIKESISDITRNNVEFIREKEFDPDR